MTVNLALVAEFAANVPPRISGKEDLLASQYTAYTVCMSRWFEPSSGSHNKKPPNRVVSCYFFIVDL